MPSVLVVDDCPVDRRLIGGLLRCIPDWTVDYASDGEEALEKVSESLPSVVVTDLQMPKLDGLGLVSELRIRHAETPVVLITSHGSEQVALDALKAGAAYYSPKRALSRDLIPTLKKVLGVSETIAGATKTPAGINSMDVAFELENDDALVGRLIEHLQINLPDWTDRNRFQIAMALNEAVINAMHHGNLEVGSELKDERDDSYLQLIARRKSTPPFSDRKVRIKAKYSNDAIEFQIADQGPGYDIHSVQDPTQPQNLERLSGRGLLLIKSFMDEILHNDCGNQITMIKRRPKS